MKMIRAWSVWLIVLAVFVLPQMASAQEEPQIQQLRIQVMPEFDDPRVLVIVQGRISGTFPQSTTFLLPAGAQINQMATIDVTTGQTMPQEYTTLPDVTDPRWTQVTYELDGAHFFYEFYYNPLNNESDKQFSYFFKSLLPVADLQVEVQEPLKASNFALAPAAVTTRVDGQFGFTYHQFQLGSLPAGQDVTIEVSYTKTDPAPSVSREQLMGVSSGIVEGVSGEETAVSSSSLSSTAMAGLVGAAIIAIIGRFFWLRRHITSTPALAGIPYIPTNHASFCSQCGSALKAQAQFCHACGSQVE